MEHGSVSFSEERLWLAAREPARCAAFVECPLHMASVVRLAGRLDVRALAASLDQLVRRHGVLRSGFVRDDGRLVRVATPMAETPVAATPLHVGGDPERALQAELADTLRRPFDLATGPLVRMRLLRLGDEEHVLALVVHHVVFDGWSLHVTWRELAALYGAYAQGQPSPLPEASAGYDAYVTWQRGRLAGERLRTLLHYWTERLRGVPELVVPSDRPRTAETSARSGTERFTIASECAEGLRRLCQERGVTAGVAFLAIFKLLLHQLTGAVDVAIGMPVADRNRPEFEPLVGLLLNVVVLRTDLSGDPTFGELLERVRRTFIGAYDHRDLPQGCLASLHGLPGEVSVAPLRVVFNFVAGRDVAPALPGLAVERVQVEVEPPSCADLSLHLFDRDGVVGGFALYKADLFDRERVRAFVARFTGIVSDVVAAPDRRISEYGVACA